MHTLRSKVPRQFEATSRRNFFGPDGKVYEQAVTFSPPFPLWDTHWAQTYVLDVFGASGGFCVSHGGGKRCQADGCAKGAQAGGQFCKSHGGGRRCRIDGCMTRCDARMLERFCDNGGSSASESILFTRAVDRRLTKGIKLR